MRHGGTLKWTTMIRFRQRETRTVYTRREHRCGNHTKHTQHTNNEGQKTTTCGKVTGFKTMASAAFETIRIVWVLFHSDVHVSFTHDLQIGKLK